MKGLVPTLNTDIPEAVSSKTTSTDDNLGATLLAKWTQWSTIRREIEEDWLKDLMAFNQQNESNVAQISKFHSHIYIGLTRTKCMSAFSRISNLMGDKHWDVQPTPIPENEANDPVNTAFIDKMKVRAEAMSKEIQDQLLDLHYEDYLDSVLLESCIIGTGCLKGVIASVKKLEKWCCVPPDGEELQPQWDVVKSEIPAPQIASPSIFDVYPDPYATRKEDMSGCFERHVLNRQQFSELKDDPRFDEVKINEILSMTDKGNHIAVWHETARRNIAKITDSTANQTERYDVLEYWGQVSGRLLSSAGVKEAEEIETYWATVWSCAGKTLLAKIMPMKKQVIPYNFFQYNKVPHQFWGISPARMVRSSQLGINGVVRSILDGMAMVAVPQAEINVTMLKEGQDPSIMKPGQIWLRDSGDPSTPAVRFFQPNIPTGQLIDMGEMFKSYADDETSLPAYTYGDQGNELNKTMGGMTLQMNAASLPIKSVIRNLEDFCIKPFITSLFDWNMQWSDKEDIKGDMQIDVIASAALLAKEQRSQQMMQLLNITANPLDAKFIDRKYLLGEIAKSMDIDPDKAVPTQMPEEEQPQAPQDTVLDQARASLLMAQVETEKSTKEKVDAEKTKIVLDSEYIAIQAANEVAMNPGIAPMGDALYKSAGGKDYNGGTLTDQQPIGQPHLMPVNTHPNFPANAPETMPEYAMPPQYPVAPSPSQGAQAGIERMGAG